MAGLSSTVVTASSAKTVTGNSAAVRVPAGANVAILALVTAATGTTPSMTLSVLWSHDGTNFAAPDGAADAFAAITAAGNVVKSIPVKGEFLQLVWTITGTTPSFTFSASAYGV